MTQENYHIGVLQDLKSAIRTAWGSDAEIEKTEICNALNEAIKALEQEPTTKNDLGIDCIDRAYIYNRIKKIDHDEDYECDEFGGSKITYHTCDWDEVLREIEDAPSVTPQEPRWIPVSERLPKDLEPVNITWINHDPEPYYNDIKDKPFTATGVYFNGQWYWWSTLCTDILAEYSHNYDDIIDDAIEVTAWMPLPSSYER